jgi:hypothetical protein
MDPLVLRLPGVGMDENSFVNVDGSMMQSVSGGGHSGGGFYKLQLTKLGLVYYF